jgi:hypothetical protein
MPSAAPAPSTPVSAELQAALDRMAEVSRQPLRRNLVLTGAYGFMIIVPTWSPTYERRVREQAGNA